MQRQRGSTKTTQQPKPPVPKLSPHPDIKPESGPLNASFLTFDESVDLAVERLGDKEKGEGWLVQAMMDHGDVLQTGRDKFSREKLEELLADTQSQHKPGGSTA